MNTNICNNKKMCTGCMACKQICPKNCISIAEETDGFSYPYINKNECVECGLCSKTCPVNNRLEGNEPLNGYVVRNKNRNILLNSTSGGTFSAFADYVRSVNGFLVGVVYDDEMRVVHVGIGNNNWDEVIRMRGSKYVQSDVRSIFCTIKEKLTDNRVVCFCGTPCQVAGLKAFLGEDYDNLVTIDLVCHGVGSPLFFKNYINWLGKKNDSKVIDAKFRSKTYGYHSSTMKVEFENGKEYYGSGRVDYMLKAFFKEAISRASCYDCPFRGKKRYGDFTIFDSWHASELLELKQDDDMGFTNMYVNTAKGNSLLDSLRENLYIREADIDKMRELDGRMIMNNPIKFKYRNELFEGICDSGFENTVQRFIPISKKDWILEYSKKMLYKLRILNIVKRIKQ